jgi:beta-lactamase regulating signal transducer with metallopeptidase domain|tara:strand:- start:892 stop:1263 length:372 start_codon:yes stop_codon:yes gene_type:complete
MKTPIVKYSDKFLARISWFMSIGGITLWPFIVLREYYQGTTNYWVTKRERTINHESIHIKQQEELLIIPFYVLYVLEWFIKLFFYGKQSYYNISFEREAYSNEHDKDYLKNRKRYRWIKRILK